MIPALLLFASTALASSSTCHEVSGNWYCDETMQVTYSGLGGVPGSYQRVTDMDSDACTCSKTTQAFSGPLSPLDEDLSLHFRGPIQLAQFAAYTMTTTTTTPTTSSRKRKRRGLKAAADLFEGLKRGMNALRQRDQYIYTLIPPIFTTSEYPSTTTTTTSAAASPTIRNDAVSTASAVAGEALSTKGTIIGLPSQVSTALAAQSTSFTITTTATTPMSTLPAISPTESTTTAAAAKATISTVWERTSYYNAAAGVMDNTVFMNNMGGVNGDNGTSGTWSSCFGNSLSYASTSGLSTSSSPILLGDVTLPSDTEVIIFSGEPCTTATCGYVADGVPAYVGFGGSDKMFLFEFAMPSDPASIGAANGDMPAIWALNAQIPRSQQYGACSCWTTGCGELDLFEILSGGSNSLTTTFHSTLGAGGATSDYFERPTNGYMKAAVIFIGDTKEIQIIELASSVTFDDQLAYDIYESWQQTVKSSVTLTD
ncbi:protein of unknown function [Taphrina deformans PYCC 5710]|uniref:glucan endo-1,3-beta-D-glucosidase n=1 Tax=Taphrina deformans (strain PYCC 5710 / ATCC 11124 / CBS 356.35 / IMI 108563 / JCM 9778 / NBRC 8474) TaxID=1097556 RepID=R4XDU4_TAPDE|nr:protein of unknown function [Taphrina deformans PYCC 5710]|eukprot:CCG84000.1 protein of unknown function [Taphrina deformans PYCC 5710]